MYKCKVCNKEFELQRKDRYIAHDNDKAGPSALVGGSEEELYDAFDCPHCGCQNVIQKRKRSYINIEIAAAKEEYITASDFEKVEEHEKCFGQYAGYVDCVTCKEERECLAESKRHEADDDEYDPSYEADHAGDGV